MDLKTKLAGVVSGARVAAAGAALKGNSGRSLGRVAKLLARLPRPAALAGAGGLIAWAVADPDSFSLYVGMVAELADAFLPVAE